MKYDVIIPMAFNEVMFIVKSLPYIEQNLVGSDRIFLITNKRYFRILGKLTKAHPRCVLLDENELVLGLTYQGVDKALNDKYNKPMRPGWYFQQFLKIGFALSSHCKEYYLSWDADTIPLRPITFFDNDNKPFFTLKSEYNKPYFDTLEKLLGIGKTVKDSFIAEHMMFRKDIVMELISELKKINLNNTWYGNIIHATDYESAGRPEMFSEFETYGNYCNSRYPTEYLFRTLSSFREAGLIRGRFLYKRSLECMSFDLDMASFELRHCPPFPWSFIHKFYKLYLSFISIIYK